MKRSFPWALILLVLWAVLGPDSVEGKETAKIVIAKDNSLLLEIEGQKPVEYGPGDTIMAEWDDGDCYLNGRLYLSRVPPPPKDFPVAMVKQMFGKVPSVLDYVRKHPGDETKVWNEAARDWDKLSGTLVRDVARQYMSDLDKGKTVDVAAARAVTALRKSSLVDSAWVSKKSRPPGSLTTTIWVNWAGQRPEHLLTFSPGMSLAWPEANPMTLDRFRDFVGLLKMLEQKIPVRIELRGAGVQVRGGRG